MSTNAYLFLVGVTFVVAFLVAIFFVVPALKKSYIEMARQDISEKEMIELEENLSIFLAENNLKVGASIWEIARKLNVIDDGEVENMSSRAKIFSKDINGHFRVVHDKKVPSNERIFDLAHELGHRINKDPLPATRPYGFNKPKRDQLADYTGAALLMPLEHICNFLIKNKYSNSTNEKRIALIRQLSKEYNVPEMVAVRRVNEVRLLKRL